MSDNTISRRTLARGAVWSIPAVAAVGTVAAFAVSHIPPPPSLAWTGACLTSVSAPGCTGQLFSLQVPMYIGNTTGEDLLFVVQGAWSAIGSVVPPTLPPPPMAGTPFGFFGPGANPSSCAAMTPPANCDTAPAASPGSKLLVPAGGSMFLWYAFNTLGAPAPTFVARIWSAWYDPATCQQISATVTNQTSSPVAPTHCGATANPTAFPPSSSQTTTEHTVTATSTTSASSAAPSSPTTTYSTIYGTPDPTGQPSGAPTGPTTTFSTEYTQTAPTGSTGFTGSGGPTGTGTTSP